MTHALAVLHHAPRGGLRLSGYCYSAHLAKEAFMESVSIKRPLIFSAALAGVLVAAGWYLDALVFAPIGLLAVFWQALRAIYYVLRRNRLALKLCGIRALIWFAAMGILVAVHNYYLKSTKKSADDLVASLQTYRMREGCFPKTLEALAPRDIPAVPLAMMAPGNVYPFRYRVSGDNADKFTLRFYTGFRHQHTYDSATGKWDLTD
jgi:hypothetical protein